MKDTGILIYVGLDRMKVGIEGSKKCLCCAGHSRTAVIYCRDASLYDLRLPGPVMMSLKPGSRVAESYSEMTKGIILDSHKSQSRPGMLQLEYIQDQLGTKGCMEGDKYRTAVSNGDDLALCSPPRTENEVKHAG